MNPVRLRAAFALGLVMAAPALAADAPPKAKSPRVRPGNPALAYIVESERLWADSLATGKTSDVERILADDFIGVAPDGKLRDKAQIIVETRGSPVEFASNRINGVTVRFFGDTAVAQGSETWERRGVDHARGRFIWTDTWLRRHGQWRIVASEDLAAPDAGE
jgi:hypothetical protein